MHRPFRVSGGRGFLLAASLLTAYSATSRGDDCTSLAAKSFPGFDVSITRAESLPASESAGGLLPPRCRVEGELERRTGLDGNSYAIGFALQMPNDWNRRFLFQGGGGLNGVIHEPVGDYFAGATYALNQGYAVVSTDSGHQAATPFDPSFMADQEALINFHYRANARVTLLAKEILETHYGSQDYRSYFVGCSTGGREAMMMSQRFPWFYDGIVAAAPAMRTNYSELGDTWAAAHLRERKADGSSGEPLLSEAEMNTVVAGLLEACDGLDGVRDQMIFDSARCNFDPQALVCDDVKTDQCLSETQADAVIVAFAGAKDSRGYNFYSPFLFDAGIADGGPGGRAIPGLLRADGGPLTRHMLEEAINWDEESIAAADFPLAFGNTSEFEHLSRFRQLGGKLIFYHGVSDPWFSALDTVRYYNNLAAANGGMEQTAHWSRLFLSPGVGHCRGGSKGLDQVNLLEPLVAWVEQDKAPKRILAKGAAFPERTRPLCAYPAYAEYDAGNPESADSYHCKQPE